MGTREPLALANHHRCVYESALWVRLIASKKALDSGRGPGEWRRWWGRGVRKEERKRERKEGRQRETEGQESEACSGKPLW